MSLLQKSLSVTRKTFQPVRIPSSHSIKEQNRTAYPPSPNHSTAKGNEENKDGQHRPFPAAAQNLFQFCDTYEFRAEGRPRRVTGLREEVHNNHISIFVRRIANGILSSTIPARRAGELKRCLGEAYAVARGVLLHLAAQNRIGLGARKNGAMLTMLSIQQLVSRVRPQ